MLKKSFRHLALAILTIPFLIFAETQLELTNPGFEQGRDGWTGETSMSQVIAEAAYEGEFGLRVKDDSDKAGSNFRSQSFPAKPDTAYALRFYARNSGNPGAVGAYLQFFDAAGKMLTAPKRYPEIILAVPRTKDWQAFTLVGKAPAEAASVSIWIHSFNGATGMTDFDNFSLSELSPEEEKTVTTTPVSSASSRRFPALDNQRVAEIAQLLPEKPAGLGRPISDRAAWDRLSAMPEAAGVIKSAEKLIDTAPPELPDELYLEFVQNGNRTRYQSPYGKRTSRISTLLRAECLENQGRFLPTLEQDILIMCDERSWVMPAHDSGLDNFHGKRLYSDLGCTARGKLLAQADWWLQDRLSATVRQRLRDEINRRMLDPYYSVIRTGDLAGHWWAIGGNNWNAVCTANVVITALTLRESVQERAEVLAAMEISNPFFLRGFTPDGYCSEGMGYWNYGFGHFMIMGETVLAATNGKLSIYNDPIIENICAFARNAQIEKGLVPAFADCGINARPSDSVLLLIQRRYPQTLHERVIVNPFRLDLDTFALSAFGDETPFAEKVAAEGQFPPHSYFQDAGIVIMRSQHPEHGQFGAAIKAGHNNEQHNHNDVGSFLVTLNGRAYIIDPGAETYTRRTFSRERYVSNMLNSYGHPVPIIAGKLQSTGRNAAGAIIREVFSDDCDHIVIDYKAAYDVPELSKLERSFTFDRKNARVEVRDDVVFSSPQSFGSALITYHRIHQRDDGALLIYDGEGGFAVTTQAEGGELIYAPEEIENPGRQSPTRLGFNFSKPVLQASIAYAIQPLSSLIGLPGFYVAPDEATFKPLRDQAISFEAEEFTAQANGEVKIEDKPGASKQAFKFWDKQGHSLSWTFTVPKAGKYALLVRCCHSFGDGVARHVIIDGKQLNADDDPFLFPGTGGWSNSEDQWTDAWLAVAGRATILDLSAGKHSLTMINADGRGLNLDWIRVVPVAP
ncbi:MAG: hypothetical protein GX945_09955 [Lentisphaerae bacterium]|nr:hypothetical protein [Lentisphaerota bacterium]